MKQTITCIDLDKTLEKAFKGIRRASVFMGLGVNAAISQDLRKYQLTDITNIRLIPNDVSDETLQHFKDEFKIWIEANGLKELVDSFIIFIDEICLVCLLISEDQTSSALEKHKKFKIENFNNKLDFLIKQFSLLISKDCLLSLNKARNCLTHRIGVVAQEDIKNKPSLTVKWQGLDAFATEPNGTTIMLNQIPKGGIYVKDGAEIFYSFSKKERMFRLNEKLLLSTRDLAEICWFFIEEIKRIRHSVEDYATKIKKNRV